VQKRARHRRRTWSSTTWTKPCIRARTSP